MAKPRTPKNIVLCSDGTGNSGGKRRGTNVWRLYHAVDRHHPKPQVASCDDGVGTSDLRWLKVLGGGQISRAIVVKAHRFSRSAQEKIAQAGGRAEVITKVRGTNPPGNA